jgi:eukaryotic-like serine/threonine-protein kinase
MVDLEGKNLGRYKLQQLIGRGGMADVYQGYDPRFERDVAIKVFKRQDEEMLRRFIREARMMASLRNSHLMPVYDTGEDRIEGFPQYYIVMPLMDGGTLRARIRRSPLTLTEVCRYLNDIADALDYIHSQGIIHRDIKASNVLLDTAGHCYLSDFGIARISTDETQLTSTGNVLGTVDYVAPELFEPHHKADVLSDLYSLGVLLFEMVTGQLPFRGDTQIVVVAMHMSKAPPLPSTFVPDIPPRVERVMLRALEKNPGRRYPSATELADAFCQAVSGRQTQDLHDAETPVWGKDAAAARTVRVEPLLLPSSPAHPPIAQPAQAPYSTGNYPYAPAEYQSQAYSQHPTQVQQQGSPARKRGLIVTVLALVLLLIIAVPIIYVGMTHTSSSASVLPTSTTAANAVPPTANFTATARVNGATATAQAASNATATAQVRATATVQAVKNATATAIVAPTATVQAQITATAGVIQTATTGTPSYTDTLTNANNAATQSAKWDNDTTHCVFEGDGYHVMQQASSINSALKGCIETGNTYTNMAVSVDVTIVSGHTGGVFFRATNQQLGGAYAGYLFEIDTQGNYKVSHSTNFSLGDSALQDWTASPSLKGGTNVKNTLEIRAAGDTLDFYVNNVFLKELSDATYSTGNIAFLATAVSGGADADVAYTNLRVFA